MNRRSFLYTSALAAAATGLARAQDAAAPRPLRKAVNLGMAAGPGSVEDKFKMIRDAGFAGIELNRPDEVPLDVILKARDASGLAIAGVICTTHWGKPLTHQDAAVREQGLRGLKLALQEAGELGCDRVLLVPGVVNKEVSYADAYTRSQAAIRQAIPVAEQAKVKIAVENVWNHFLLSPLESARFVDELASPWVGWHFDIGNVVTYGWPDQWVRTLGKRILNLHIKDFSRAKSEKEGLWKGFDVELGDGDANWPAVMTALRELDYQGWAIAEVPGGDAARLSFLSTRMDKILA